ncbi:MAG TPA: SGNH/GDSL hydrolase family protein [Gemmatimonadaceae bacterium]|nr:SGNH/GDSL hydrolase family protein [Gemmatimonadaceae bacterium]
MSEASGAMQPTCLALGDSYTIGEGVSPSERWPARLAVRLRETGVAIAEPTIVARTGWTTDELAAAIDATPLVPPYALVTLLIGVNNQYRGRSAAEYRDEFRTLLARAIGFAGGRAQRVVVLSIPDWSATPFAADRDRPRIAREIDEFNVVNRDEAARVDARYVDVTVASRTAAGDLAFVAADGLHPSAAAYDQWARLVLPVAAAILGRRAADRADRGRG